MTLSERSSLGMVAAAVVARAIESKATATGSLGHRAGSLRRILGRDLMPATAAKPDRGRGLVEGAANRNRETDPRASPIR